MPSWTDLTGKKAGTLIAQEYLGGSRWRCICAVCGAEVFIGTDGFNALNKRGRDGCKHAVPIKIGDTFGYLTVIRRADDYIKPKSGAHEKQWLCKCVCGREKVILEDNLKASKSITCGLCSNRVSIPEKAIVFYLRKVFNEVEENYRPDFLDGKEIDIYVPSIKLGIEYDGGRWHSDVVKDLAKDKKCAKNGIRIIRIREPECRAIRGSIVTPKAIMNGNHMTEPIKTLLSIIERDYHIKVDQSVDCRRDSADICKTLLYSNEERSLAKLHPEIAAEWDYDRNSPLTPDKIAARSGRKAWWVCPNGHRYSSVVATRVGSANSKRSGCPICANVGASLYVDGKYIGEHSLAKERPDIAAEYMNDKNEFSSDNISVGSNKKAWFKCSKCGYEWQSKINNRTSNNNQGCPACGKEKLRLSISKPIICVETGIKYDSTADAKRKTGINNISACIHGRLTTAGGYHWISADK